MSKRQWMATTGMAAAVLLLGGAKCLATDEPVLSLSFEKGFVPDTGPTNALRWSARRGAWACRPPEFVDGGVKGKALRVTENLHELGFDLPVMERKQGTLLLWIKEPDGLVGTRFMRSWGPGWAGITEGSLQSSHSEMMLRCIYFPSLGTGQWAQFGISWNNEGAGRIRLYRNGRQVQEVISPFSSESILIGADNIPEGRSLLIDSVRLWDRVLTDSEVKSAYHRDYQPLTQPLVSVPRLRVAPTVDGTLLPKEWAGAARVTGMLQARTGELATDQSAFFLGYDDTFLYVAMQGDMTELARTQPAAVYERFLRAEQTGRKQETLSDDAVEIVVSPDFWKAAARGEPGDWKEYRALGNSVGGSFSASYAKTGTDTAWDVAWQTASRVSKEGWQFEGRIPLAALGGAVPTPGELWGLQLGRIWKQLKDEHDLWTWGTRASETNDAPRRLHVNAATEVPLSNFGVMRFACDTDVVVRVTRIGRPSERLIDFEAGLLNQATNAQKVTATLRIDTGDVALREVVVVPAGGEKTLAWKRPINDFASSRLVFEVTGSDGAVLHRTDVGYHIEQKFEVRMAQYPNYEKFMVSLNLGAFSEVPLTEMTVDLNVRNASGKTVYESAGRKIDSYSPQIEDTTARWKLGDYTMAVAIRRGAQTLACQEVAFAKIAKAAWWEHRYGYEDVDADVPPYPWTDMTVAKNTVYVWGREYRFGDTLLPEQVTTLGCPILRAPMRLVMTTAAGETLDTSQSKARAKWTKRSKTRIEGIRTVRSRDVDVRNHVWAEYDGLVWCTLTVTPRRKTTISSLAIEVPIDKAFTDVSWGSWFGNGDGGIQIFQEGNRFLDELKNPVRVEKEAGEATWRMVLVDRPTELDAPCDITLGFMATPVKAKTWRTPSHDSRQTTIGGPFFPETLGPVPAPDPEGKGWGGRAAYIWTSDVGVNVDAAGTDDFKLYGAEWMDDPFQMPKGAHGGNSIRPSLASPSFRDWFIWRYSRYQRLYGLDALYIDNPSEQNFYTRDIVKRLYNVLLDGPGSDPLLKRFGGAANGQIDLRFMSFYTIHADGEQFNGCIEQWKSYIGHIGVETYRREFMGHNIGWPVLFLGQGRLRREWVEADGGPEVVYDHLSGLGLLHDGPYQAPNVHAHRHVCCVLPNPMEEVSRRMVDALETNQFRHWAYQFVPYWRQDIVALPDTNLYASFYIAQPSKLIGARPEEIDAYFERCHPRGLPETIRLRNRRAVEQERGTLQGMTNKVVMIVYNNGTWQGELRLKPDWGKLGLGAPETLKAENAVHSTGFRLEKTRNEKGEEVEKAVFFPRPEEYAKIEGEELVFPMTKFNYRMIVIEKR